MNPSLRYAVLALLVLLPACSRPSSAAAPPARRTPIDFPSAPASASIEVEVTPPAEIIDVETGEQLAMRATATMTIVAGSKTTTETLSSNDLVETVLEQSEGETQRILRLSAADPKRQDDVQFSVEGIAAPGTFKTGERELRVVFFDAPLGVDLLSDQGECTVVFDRVETSDVTGNVTCANIESPTGKVQLSATFKAETVEP